MHRWNFFRTSAEFGSSLYFRRCEILAAQFSAMATVLQLGACTLPGKLQEPFEQKYKVLHADGAKEEDLDRLGPEKLSTVQGIIMYGGHARITESVLARLPSLRVVSTVSVGFNHIDLAACKSKGIAVGYTPGAVDGATADVAWGLILAACRHIVLGHTNCTGKDFRHIDPNWFGKEVFGSTLGIVGMGGVGLAVARRALGFDMPILYHNRNRRDPEVEKQVKAEYVSSLKELMSRSDIIVCCVPASAESMRMFNSEVFSACKRGAVFVNVSRGSVVDQHALVDHLRNGQLYSAGLDVTDPEPLPRDHPLLHMDNVVVTPHIGTATENTRVCMTEMGLRSLEAGLAGQAPLAVPPV